MNKSLRTRFFIRFGLAAKELCERKKSHNSENKRKNNKNPNKIFPLIGKALQVCRRQC